MAQHLQDPRTGKMAGSTAGKNNAPVSPAPSPAGYLDMVRGQIVSGQRKAELGHALMYAWGLQGMTEVARTAHPAAATVELVDINDDGGSPYFLVGRILDADGVELWSADTATDTLQDDLAEFSPYLDRDVPDSDRRHAPASDGRDVWIVRLD